MRTRSSPLGFEFLLSCQRSFFLAQMLNEHRVFLLEVKNTFQTRHFMTRRCAATLCTQRVLIVCALRVDANQG